MQGDVHSNRYQQLIFLRVHHRRKPSVILDKLEAVRQTIMVGPTVNIDRAANRGDMCSTKIHLDGLESEEWSLI